MEPESAPLTLVDFFGAWEVYEPGVLAAVVIGATLGVLGVYVVLRRLVFLSAALGQSASFGVVLSLLLFSAELGAENSSSPVLGAIALSFVATLLVAGARGSPVFRDGALGAVFLLGAAGTILVGSRLTHEMHEIEALLHGVGVAVLPEDLAMVSWLAAFVLLAHTFGWRGFSAVSFDAAGAEVRRVPVRFFEVLLALTLAVGIAAGIRVLGALPVFALSVMPSLAATRLGRNIPESLVIGALFGAIAGLYGYMLAFLLDLPVGASQTAMALVLAAVIELARRVTSLGSPRLIALPKSSVPAWGRPMLVRLTYGLMALAVLIALTPLRAALDGGSGEPLAWLGLALGVFTLALVWRVRERGAIAPGLTVALIALALATFAWSASPGWTELVRPIVQAGTLAAIGASAREAAHRLNLEKA